MFYIVVRDDDSIIYRGQSEEEALSVLNSDRDNLQLVEFRNEEEVDLFY